MKKIVSKAILILSVIFFAISICVMSGMDFLKGYIPIQDTIIDSGKVIYNLQCADMRALPYKLIPLFYIAIVLMLISSIVNFSKTYKIKSIITAILSFIPPILVLITHNYIWFLILLNLYMILFILFDLTIKNKATIYASIIAIVITILNIIQLIRHLNLEFDVLNIPYFEENLINLSGITLKVLLLWFVPFTILLVNDIIITLKKHKDCH